MITNERTTNDLLLMPLHETCILYDSGWGTSTEVMRVPGGWVYIYKKSSYKSISISSAFVPEK